jgi:hypothetical protein
MLPRAPVVYSWSAPHANGPLLLVLQHFFFLVFWSYIYPSCNPVSPGRFIQDCLAFSYVCGCGLVRQSLLLSCFLFYEQAGFYF